MSKQGNTYVQKEYLRQVTCYKKNKRKKKKENCGFPASKANGPAIIKDVSFQIKTNCSSNNSLLLGISEENTQFTHIIFRDKTIWIFPLKKLIVLYVERKDRNKTGVM